MSYHAKKLEEDSSDETSKKLLELEQQWRTEILLKEEDPEWKKDNLEYDLRTTDWILEKVRTRDDYAQNLYAAMCNREFQRLDVMPILKDETWGCSWRYAGGIIADMQEKGDYIDWYCSGIRDSDRETEDTDLLYVTEGTVTDEVREDLNRLGWAVLDD
jgi:hypothetical protein